MSRKVSSKRLVTGVGGVLVVMTDHVSPLMAGIIQKFRRNPAWRMVDAVQDGRMMEQVWKWAAAPTCAYRKIFDLRLAATLHLSSAVRRKAQAQP